MYDFDGFFDAYGNPSSSETASRSLLEKMDGKVPEALLSFWTVYGFGSYGKGLVWVLNPTELDGILAEWPADKRTMRRSVPIIRTAFGNVVFWANQEFTFLDVHYNRLVQAGTDTELLFGYYLTHAKSRRSVLEEQLFKKAYKKLGQLTHEEIYTYSLPLALGGKPELKNLCKAKVKEQLSILAQIHKGP